jgi:hypothetical protein
MVSYILLLAFSYDFNRKRFLRTSLFGIESNEILFVLDMEDSTDLLLISPDPASFRTSSNRD